MPSSNQVSATPAVVCVTLTADAPVTVYVARVAFSPTLFAVKTKSVPSLASDGTDLVFTANSVGENATRATYTVTGASAVSVTQTTAGVADTWFDDGTTTASLESIAVVDISTQIGASYSIATIDGALETVSGIRGL